MRDSVCEAARRFIYEFRENALESGVKLLRTLLRGLAAGFFVVAGVIHFLKPKFYLAIIPPYFPAPQALVAISGVAEIAGGIGLCFPTLRRAAGWGLVALLVAVFPANLYMAQHPDHFQIAGWILWARLPLQAVFIAWVWFVAIQASPQKQNGLETAA